MEAVKPASSVVRAQLPGELDLQTQQNRSQALTALNGGAGVQGKTI